MAAYDPAVIKGYLAIVDNPPTNAAKGKAFEDLACYLLNGIPGITITARNEMNTFATEEIDVACKNENDPAGLGALVDFFLVECKGWRDAVNSEQVSWFLTKIRHRGVRFGILDRGKRDHRRAGAPVPSQLLGGRRDGHLRH